ncbi:TetR/AcrR family transcriptional regulator [Sporolactobacillus laevolacticus]|uniref:TetR/AcrR family transcriptional regulator n=1 Tax=Sporolactobacillus laevolacticus TaxID=33018 RepID=UPI0025B50261|nr:TetR/AcrR family transcriptional regulator [Sporolactobacillus laevolacticus]MDN3954403.1 TetR/AcrR family transcriptional regulator [Sporolactobacillus laevolacticus]
MSVKMTSRDLQAMERRKQILDVSKILFLEKGYHATSMRMINKTVGLSEALTYHYFPNGKLEIFKAVIEAGHEKTIKQIQQVIQTFRDDLPLKDALITYGKMVHLLFAADDSIIPLAIREHHLLDKSEYTFINETTQQLIDTFISYLTSLKVKPKLKVFDLRLGILQYTYNFTTSSLFGESLFNDNYDEYVEKIADLTIKLWCE